MLISEVKNIMYNSSGIHLTESTLLNPSLLLWMVPHGYVKDLHCIISLGCCNHKDCPEAHPRAVIYNPLILIIL